MFKKIFLFGIALYLSSPFSVKAMEFSYEFREKKELLLTTFSNFSSLINTIKSDKEYKINVIIDIINFHISSLDNTFAPLDIKKNVYPITAAQAQTVGLPGNAPIIDEPIIESLQTIGINLVNLKNLNDDIDRLWNEYANKIVLQSDLPLKALIQKLENLPDEVFDSGQENFIKRFNVKVTAPSQKQIMSAGLKQTLINESHRNLNPQVTKLDREYEKKLKTLRATYFTNLCDKLGIKISTEKLIENYRQLTLQLQNSLTGSREMLQQFAKDNEPQSKKKSSPKPGKSSFTKKTSSMYDELEIKKTELSFEMRDGSVVIKQELPIIHEIDGYEQVIDHEWSVDEKENYFLIKKNKAINHQISSDHLLQKLFNQNIKLNLNDISIYIYKIPEFQNNLIHPSIEYKEFVLEKIDKHYDGNDSFWDYFHHAFPGIVNHYRKFGHVVQNGKNLEVRIPLEIRYGGSYDNDKKTILREIVVAEYFFVDNKVTHRCLKNIKQYNDPKFISFKNNLIRYLLTNNPELAERNNIKSASLLLTNRLVRLNSNTAQK